MKYINFWFHIYTICVWQHGAHYDNWMDSIGTDKEDETSNLVLYWERLRDYSLARYHKAVANNMVLFDPKKSKLYTIQNGQIVYIGYLDVKSDSAINIQ